MKLVAVGTVAFDTIETPFGKAERVLGGSATYIALSARFFCRSVGLVAVVGGDFPDEFIRRLEEGGANLEGLEVVPDGETFFYACRYHYDLNERESLATHLNVLNGFNPVVPEAYRSASVVCLGNIDPITQRKTLAQVADPRLVVCDTMNLWIDKMPEELRTTLALVDCLVINDSEARQLAGEHNLIRAAAVIRAMGPEILIIKKGEHGALLFAGDQVFSAPAYPLEDIYDPTGAGDSFLGGFAGYLAGMEDFSIDSLKRAVIFGSAAASFCVERFGPDRLLEVSAADIDRRVAAFQQISAIPALAPLSAA